METTTTRQQYREAVAVIAAKAKAKLPECNGRVEKAVALVLSGDVTLHADGTATVYSATDPTRRYELGYGGCMCRDYEQAPHGLCKHRLAGMIATRVQQHLPPVPDELEPWPDNDPEPWPETDPAPQPPAAPVAAPHQEAHVTHTEAPASANAYIMVGGHRVQITLRDSDETRLLARLTTLLSAYPPAAAQPARPEAPPVVEEPVCPYHGKMKPSTKGPGTWFCASKMGDGTYCKERYPRP